LIERTPDAGSVIRSILPDELSDGFRRLGLKEGNRVVMHASLESMGTVEGGAAMVLHRLLRSIGKNGTLLMPTFTSVTRHTSTHDNYTRAGCWCEGKENRHLPFISELQPDKDMGCVPVMQLAILQKERAPRIFFCGSGQEFRQTCSRIFPS
jgi:hypothetical protein